MWSVALRSLDFRTHVSHLWKRRLLA